MGVMIKGLEMPKNCMGCSTKCDPENRKCNIDGHVFEETFAVVTNQRDKDCPLGEIVTCKDCKYWYRDGLSAISGNCEKLSHRERNSTLYVEIERKTVETSYCSDGKRRGSEE